ncbi:hypothetical protein OHA88_34810 [Streptomyces sp. NBC_00353]|uniref:hypothetical protein n=1 Tax=Streptomyces sp. NBC_00353 TaxID=2975722 RepID=UPI002E256272
MHMRNDDTSQRGLWAAIIMVGALAIGFAATGLFWSTGTQVSGALGAGGAAFLGTATLGITVRRFLTD